MFIAVYDDLIGDNVYIDTDKISDICKDEKHSESYWVINMCSGASYYVLQDEYESIDDLFDYLEV